MDNDEEEKDPDHVTAPYETTENRTGSTAVNSLILDYYKKFGRKRDLEQYFSLTTAQSDVKDTSGTFWTRMKSENDSSDGEKRSDSSQELCRISIRCSMPDPCSSQYHAKPDKPILTGSALLESLGIHIKPLEEESKSKSESVSPPIITEEAIHDVTQNSDEESFKSYGNNSHKSLDVLDSTNKPLSPSSSITSQRKLEWDSLADVGYANESDRKTSASSLSTLERLALKQQYSNSDTKLGNILEPTAHSTPMEENVAKTKTKKGVGKKSAKIYKKDVEYLEMNVPHTSENNPPQTINVNLTRQISFNVEKDGKVSIKNVQKDVSISPEKINAETAVSPRVRMEKEMQTSLNKFKDLPQKSVQNPKMIPVLISLNTLRRRTRRKKLRKARKKLRSKKRAEKENIPVQEKSGEQLSEAESFEYMPGHMYNQNQLAANEQSGNTAGNKSSLESSGLLTTDSSKGSKHSFTKDLEKSIDILKAALQKGDDTNLRKQLIKQVCERLIKSKYRDDESSTDFLSGLSFSSKKLGLGEGNNTTTSTSDNTGEKLKRPKKSILRNDKFNAGAIASTSQSAPNLPTASNSEKLVSSNLMKNLTTSNTDSDISRKEKSSSDNVFAKTSSQELYQRYLDALKREENYKRHLKDKEMFLKQKLVCSDSAIRAPTSSDPKMNDKLKDLLKDLTRNNYDDGSGDASKLEGGPNSSRSYDRFVPIKSQRSHSVFTLSSGNTDPNKQNLKKRLQRDLKDLAKPGSSREHYCCCPNHSPKSKACGIDSSVQVNIPRSCDNSSCDQQNLGDKPSPRRIEQGEAPRSLGNVAADDGTGDIKYVCLCNSKTIKDVPDNFLIFKCSKLDKGNQESSSISSNSSCRSRNNSPRKNKTSLSVAQCTNENTRKDSPETICEMKTTTKSSQTNFLLKMLRRRSSERSPPSSCYGKKSSRKECSPKKASPVESKVYEATRWLQTEISINPRIPEPSLSDINIVTNCANLVSEQCRRISKPSLVNVFSQETSCNTGSSKSSGTSKDIGELFDDEKQKTFEIKSVSRLGSDSERSEKYTIPIQGTNMTLMVSIGANERKNKPEDMIEQCIGTERSKVTEQGTSLTEECSKGVQYDISYPIKTDQNSNHVGIQKDQRKSPCIVNTCRTVEDTAFNTYPKISPVNEQKPLRRANTDTDNFSKCVATDTLNNKCDKPEKNTGSDINKCSCGCNGTKEHCTDKCKEKNKCEINPVAKTPAVEKETQYSEPNSPKCSRNSAGNIKDCNKTCDERKKSLTIENVKKLEGSFCSCGCGGGKDECNKNCDERKKNLPKSPRCNGDVKNREKNCEQHKISLSTQCSCGCSGNKENCSKNCDERKEKSNEVGIQKDSSNSSSQTPRDNNDCRPKSPERKKQNSCSVPSSSKNISENDSRSSEKCKTSESETVKETDPILEMIQNITKKYSKNDFEKGKRKKCFKEIMAVLNYLLETEDSTIRTENNRATSESSTTCEKPEKISPLPKKPEKSSQKSKRPCITESSDCPQSTDIPGTSSDSATCKVLNKIKKECERYHQKRCKIHSGKKCDISSSTSANCDQCRRVHHCVCRNHKCKAQKKCEKVQKKAVAYNLILQTTESISEETVSTDKERPLQNIVVKVPSQRKYANVPFKEMCAKIESRMPPCEPKPCRSKSLPNESEISSMEEFLRRSQACCTVREYLEQNRPDFIAKSSQRQDCLRIVSDSRENMRAAQRALMSVRLAQLSDVNDLDSAEIRQLAEDLGRHMRQKRPAPKFISERSMKKHSQNIYQSLPEVVQKKEEAKKENIKKTNLLMANIFEKNLQKKTLRGSVDISNYSPIIKI